MSSIFRYIGNSLWFVGEGALLFNGVRLSGNPTASTTLQFILFENDAYDSGVVFEAGLTTPSAATIAEGGAGTKLQANSYSVRLTAIRSSTGAESTASIQSNVVTLNANKKLSITFPSAVGNGHDEWGVYVTQAGRGSIGPHLSLPPSLTGESPAGFVKESTVAAAGGRTIDFEWHDGDLVGRDLAPIANNPPPPGTHAFTIEGCMCVAGCYAGPDGVTVDRPGSMIAVSRAGFPEAFPVDVHHLLALPEPPTCVLTRAAGGFVYVSGQNSLSAVRYTGAQSKAPLELTVLWPDVGFSFQDNACLADGVLYGYNAVKGLVRIDGEGNPDYRFSAAVAKYFEGIPASAVKVGYDPSTQHVVYGFTHGGVSRLICYNKAWDVWSTPIEFENFVDPPPLPATIITMYTDDGSLFIVLDVGEDEYAVYRFNSGTGSTWKLRSAWRDGGYPEKNKTITAIHTATGNDSNNTTTVKAYTNLSDTAKATKNYEVAGTAEHLNVLRTNLRNAKTYSVEITGTDDDTLGLEAVVEGVVSAIDH